MITHLAVDVVSALTNSRFLLVVLALSCATPFAAQAQTGNTKHGTNALDSVTTGDNNTAIGESALTANSTGSDNTASGYQALYTNTGGIFNTASGYQALYANSNGSSNTASGYQALYSNISSNNTATGLQTLYYNTSGFSNTATGGSALYSNTTGGTNTATGVQALYFNTSGSNNTADGAGALLSNNTGHHNTASGAVALYKNTTGVYGTAAGFQALYNNTTGNYNTANGVSALYQNTTGFSNIAFGYGSLFANTIGSNNIALGTNAGLNLTTGSYNIDIGNVGVAAEANTTRIGSVQTRAFVAGIRGVTTANANAVPVVIDSAGQLGTASSSRRFKHDIKPMEQSSESILALHPVTFHYNEDASETAQFGLIAEEVEKVNPDLVVHDDQGKPYTVRYEAVNAMLLNEFLKSHHKIQQQEEAIAGLRSQISSQDEIRSIVSRQQEQIAKLAAVLKGRPSLHER